MNNNSVNISRAAESSIRELESLLAGIAPEQLIETALAITAALYRKSAEGGKIRVEFPDGKTEELRFSVKRPAKKSGRTQV
jgi:hypothetical protein